MERVSNDGFFSYRRDVEKKKSKRGERIGSGLFSRSLDAESLSASEVHPEETEAETAELLRSVFEAGDALRRELTSVRLEEYRSAVRGFLSAVVQRGLDVEDLTSGANILKRKRYTLVRVVDSRLEELAAGMVSSQANQLELLAKVDEINGLLVDLTR